MRVPCRLFVLVAVLAACGGGGGDPGPTTPPDNTLASVTIEPQATTVSVGGTTSLDPTARNSRGTAIAAINSFIFTSSDQSKATVSNDGVVTGVAAGAVTITATATSGGVTRSGTANVEVTLPDGPVTATVAATPANVFAPDDVEIAVGEAVRWNFGTVAHNVVFRNTANRPPDIATQSATSVVRTFRAAGDYGYDCTLHAGMTGTVVVR